MDARTKFTYLALSCMFNMGAHNILQSFVPIYMKDCGLTETQIGSIGAWAVLFSMTLTFIIGNLADRLQIARRLVIVLILLHSLSSVFYVFARGYFHFLGLDMLRSVAHATTASMIPLLVLSVLPTKKRGKHYSRYRIWGSVGFFCFAMIGGVFAERHGIPSLFSAAGGCFVIAAIAFSAVKTGSNAPPLKTSSMSQIFSTPRLVIFYLSLIPFALWTPVCFRFLQLYMHDLGGSHSLIGCLMGSMGLLGIIGLPIVGRLTDHYGVVPLIAVNFLLVPIRLISYPLISNPYWIFVPNLIHIMTFPICEICFLLFIERYCVPELRNTAMVLIVMFRSIGWSAGSFLGGYLAQSMGYPTMFYITGAISSIAFLIFMVGMRKTRPVNMPGE